MIFKPILIEKIMAGDKTVTRRPHPSQYKAGKYVKIQPGMARESMARIWIIDVRAERLGDLTDEDALLEGFEAVDGMTPREHFFWYWTALYKTAPDPEMLVDRIEFELQDAWLDLCPKCNGSGMVNHASTYEGIAL